MKNILGLLMLLVLVQPMQAQKPGFISGGLSLLVGHNSDNEQTIILPSLTIFPGFKIIQKKEFTLLAGTPASVGFSAKNDHVYVGVDLPVTLNTVFGYGFSNESKGIIGFFLGGGAGYHNSYNETDFSDGTREKDHVEFIGFLVHSGVMFPFDKTDKKNGMLIRLSWMSDYPDHHKNVYGIGLIVW
jgi:hypothetical protein